MDSETTEKFLHLLSKEVLKQSLAKAGLYALAYELLKNSIIERTRAFFTMGGTKPDDEYKKQVLSKDANRLIASCLWLRENGAITEDEVAEFLQLREHRNYIVHELSSVLLDPTAQGDEAKLLRLFRLLSKIERWWVTEVEIAGDPDFDGQEINPSEVRSGSMEFVSYLIKVAYDLDEVTPGATMPN
jgi:hypothetical protein